MPDDSVRTALNLLAVEAPPNNKYFVFKKVIRIRLLIYASILFLYYILINYSRASFKNHFKLTYLRLGCVLGSSFYQHILRG